MGGGNSANEKEAKRNAPDSSFEANEDIMFMRVSPNNRVIAIGSCNEIRLYNPLDNSFIKQLEGSCFQKCGVAISTCAFSPDSKYLAYRWDDKVRVYNLESESSEKDIKLDDGQSARTISFSPDGQRILVGCHYDHIQIYTMNADSSQSF